MRKITTDYTRKTSKKITVCVIHCFQLMNSYTITKLLQCFTCLRMQPSNLCTEKGKGIGWLCSFRFCSSQCSRWKLMGAYRVTANAESRYNATECSLKEENLLLHPISNISLEYGFGVHMRLRVTRQTFIVASICYWLGRLCIYRAWKIVLKNFLL